MLSRSFILETEAKEGQKIEPRPSSEFQYNSLVGGSNNNYNESEDTPFHKNSSLI